MCSTTRTLRIAAAGFLLALALYGILAVPGLVADSASTVPDRAMQRAAQ